MENLTAKKYLNSFFDNPESVQRECLERVSGDVLLEIIEFSSVLENQYEKDDVKFNCFGVLVVLGYLLKDNLIRSDLESCLNMNQLDILKESNKRDRFMTYDEFLRRFKDYECHKISEELGFDPKNCEVPIKFKCMSIGCYNCWREAYFGE